MAAVANRRGMMVLDFPTSGAWDLDIDGGDGDDSNGETEVF